MTRKPTLVALALALLSFAALARQAEALLIEPPFMKIYKYFIVPARDAATDRAHQVLSSVYSKTSQLFPPLQAFDRVAGKIMGIADRRGEVTVSERKDICTETGGVYSDWLTVSPCKNGQLTVTPSNPATPMQVQVCSAGNGYTYSKVCVYRDTTGLYMFDDGPSIPVEAEKALPYPLSLEDRRYTTLFWAAGQLHDRCYHHHWNVSKRECDVMFQNAMNDICEGAFASTYRWFGRAQCRRVADVMYEAVNRFGQSAYDAGSSMVDWRRDGTVAILGDPTAVLASSGVLATFARGTADQLVHQWQHPDGTWSLPVGLKARIRGAPAVVNAINGAMALFARGIEGQLIHTWQTSAGGNWAEPISLGGHITSAPKAVVTPSGAIAVFARGANGDVQHIFQTAPLGGWSTWVSLGGSILDEPAPILSASGAVALFARGRNNDLAHAWQLCEGCNFSGWISMGGNVATAPSVFYADVTGTKALQVFTVDPAGVVSSRRQTVGLGNWDGWVTLGGTLNGHAPAPAFSARYGPVVFGTHGVSKDVLISWVPSGEQSFTTWSTLGGSLEGKLSVANQGHPGGYGPIFAIFGRTPTTRDNLGNYTGASLRLLWNKQTQPAGGMDGWRQLGK